MSLTQLKRLRWIVTVATLLGIGSSVMVNVFHAPDNPLARFIAGAPPLAVWGCLELITRIPGASRGLTGLRVTGAAVVALGACAISYFQQFRAVQSLGFPTWQAMIWPVIIDGMMIVTSVSLLEVVRKIRQVTDMATPSKVREMADRFETPETLAYRAAQRKLREEEASAIKALNGNKVGAVAS